MARIKTTAYPVNVFSKYTIKELHNLIKAYNIPYYARLKKLELIQYLDGRFTLNGNTLVLKHGQQFPADFQTSNNDLEFNDLFSDFNEQQNPLLMQSMDLPVALKRVAPATKGNRKVLPSNANRKIMPPRPRGRPRKVPI